MKFFLYFILLVHLVVAPLFSSTSSKSISRLQIPALLIADPGNKACFYSGRSIGSVAKSFFISKYEITASYYCTFLNAVAAQEDPHQLYKNAMTEDPLVACISRTTLTKEDGSFFFHYEPLENRGSLPITYVSLCDAERFCNWLENNAPTSDDDPLFLKECTERGAYLFLGGINGEMEEPTLCSDAHYYIPSEDEWFKAAYYKGGGSNAGYWSYPTKHDAAPNNGQGDFTNQANYRTMATGWEPREKNPLLTSADRFDQTFSAYGVCDMGGNVAEWTSSLQEQHSSPHLAEYNIVRGGSWNSEYSIYWNNELMAQSIPQAYDSLTANNFIGFRIAAVVPEEEQDDQAANSMDHCSDSKDAIESFALWTVLRGILFGCPREMLKIVFKFFHWDAETILGVTSLEEVSFSVLASILLLDLLGYIAIMGVIALLGQLIPWSSLEEYFTRMAGSSKDSMVTPIMPEHPKKPITLQETIVQSVWSFIRSLIGCGMCLLTAFLSTLQIIAARLGIGTACLTRIKDFFEGLNVAFSMEDASFAPAWLEGCIGWLISYIPGWLLARLVPVVLELGFLGLFIFGSYEFLYYWPAIQDSLAQLWYGHVNCSGTSALDVPGVVY